VQYYLPNSADCEGWKGYVSGNWLATNAMTSGTSLTSGELDDLSADDSNYVSTVGQDGQAPGVKIRFVIPMGASEVEELQVTFEGYGRYLGGGQDQYQLFMWDDNEGRWYQKDIHTSASKDTLEASITENCADYVFTVGSDKVVDCLVIGPSGDVSYNAQAWTYYARLAVEAPIRALVEVGTEVLCNSVQAYFDDVLVEVGTEVTCHSIHENYEYHRVEVGTEVLCTVRQTYRDDVLVNVGTDVLETDLQTYVDDVLIEVGVDVLETDLQTYIDHVLVNVGLEVTAFDMHCFPLELWLTPNAPNERIVRWTDASVSDPADFCIVIDGKVLEWTQNRWRRFTRWDTIRQYLRVGIPPAGLSNDEIEAWLPTPEDEVQLSITNPGESHTNIERKLGAGEFAEIAETHSTFYIDGPLVDGVYTYRLVAEDEQGDTATSNEEQITISSTPEPPTALALEVQQPE